MMRGRLYSILIGAVLLILFLLVLIPLRDIRMRFLSGNENSQIDMLETELARVRYQAILYESVQQKLARIEEAVRLAPTPVHLARVRAVPPQTHYDSLLIAAGSENGVQIGDTVHVEGFAIGTIVEVSTGSALAELFSAPGKMVEVQVGVPRARVTAYGEGGGVLVALLPDALAIAPGDVAYHKDFPFTVVQSIEERANDTTQVVRLAIPVSFSSIEFVSLTREL